MSLSVKWPLGTMSFLLSSLLIFLTVSTPSWGQSSETTSPKASDGTPFPWNKMRLPEHIIPGHYDLMIHANLTTLTFKGTTAIEITASQRTSAIILHSNHLQISKATLKKGAGERQSEEPLRVLEYPPHEQIALLAPEPLVVGLPYTIVIEYAGNLSESFHGFYKSTYRTKEGEVRYFFSIFFKASSTAHTTLFQINCLKIPLIIQFFLWFCFCVFFVGLKMAIHLFSLIFLHLFFILF